MIEAKSIDLSLGRMLKEQRILAGLSQSELGEKVGLTFQQIQKYESALNRISSSRLVQLSAILGVDPIYFFQNLDHDANSSLPNSGVVELTERDFDLEKESLSLTKNFYKIKDKNLRKKVIEIVKAMADE